MLKSLQLESWATFSPETFQSDPAAGSFHKGIHRCWAEEVIILSISNYFKLFRLHIYWQNMHMVNSKLCHRNTLWHCKKVTKIYCKTWNTCMLIQCSWKSTLTSTALRLRDCPPSLPRGMKYELKDSCLMNSWTGFTADSSQGWQKKQVQNSRETRGGRVEEETHSRGVVLLSEYQGWGECEDWEWTSLNADVKQTAHLSTSYTCVIMTIFHPLECGGLTRFGTTASWGVLAHVQLDHTVRWILDNTRKTFNLTL